MAEYEPTNLLRSALGLKQDETPFPWQQDLLNRMLQRCPPQSLDIPTGLGKTSVMAIWLVARVCGAILPRRLVYVVDRRAIVDQATEVALGLREWLEQNAAAKEKLGLQGRSLPISTLRGKHADNREWLENPAAPAIIVGTVDMIGSRLLFEGYGVSRKMRPYHAGLMGCDTLLVLDESHLVPPFEHLLRTIADDPVFRPCDQSISHTIPPFRLLALSATGRTQSNHVVTLTEKDRSHDTVKKRLNAKKSLRVQTLDPTARMEEALASHAWRLSDDGKQALRVIVFCDKRKVAKGVHSALERLVKNESPIHQPDLFVGGRRVFEREAAKKRLEELGFIPGSKVERSVPSFLVATSAGEVGVDLDADHMVCDLVTWERMVQRLGRVNRRGEPVSHVAQVLLLVEPKPQPKNRLEKEAVAKQERNEKLDENDRKRLATYENRVREWENLQKPLNILRTMPDGSLDASVNALTELRNQAHEEKPIRKILDDASSPELLRPALTLPLVEAWSLTSLKNHPGRPVIQPWLRGWVEDIPQTAVVWRTYLPVRKSGGLPRPAEIESFFEAAPPHTSEILETDTNEVADWILGRAKSMRNGANQEQPEQKALLGDADPVALVLDKDTTLRELFTLADLKAISDKDKFKDKIKWATVVLDARLAGMKNGLLDDTSSTPPLTADTCNWLGEGVVGFRVRTVDASGAAISDQNWRERFRLAREISQDGDPTEWLIVDKWRDDAATEDDRAEGAPQLLIEHQERTRECATTLAQLLGLDKAYEAVLALAARFHDEGKRAKRWQRAFNAPSDGTYAKTDGPINHRLLDGYRHELGSILRIKNDKSVCSLPEDQRDLVLHLIAAHHGFARPVIGTSGCEDAPPSLLEDEAAAIALRFARLQSRWGPWGLAWWEALLRAADQLASRDTARDSAGRRGA